MGGVDLKTVQELLGHKSYEMTLRYAHLSPDHKKLALDVLCKRIVTNRSQGERTQRPMEGADLESVYRKEIAGAPGRTLLEPFCRKKYRYQSTICPDNKRLQHTEPNLRICQFGFWRCFGGRN